MMRIRNVPLARLAVYAPVLGGVIYLLFAPFANPAHRVISGVLVCAVLALFFFARRLWPGRHDQARVGLTIGLITVTVIFHTGVFILLRQINEPHEWIHDSALQTEEAMRMVARGGNPYVEDYRTTPLADWDWNPGGHENPALDHYVYLPGMFLSGMPMFVVWEQMFGWYDQRLFQLIVLAGFVGLLLAVSRGRPHLQIVMLSATLLQPLFFFYFIVGHNDILIYLAILAAGIACMRGSYRLGMVSLAIAAVLKQSAWVFIPLFALLVVRHALLQDTARFRWLFRQIWPAVLTAGMVILPFLILDLRAFTDDTLLYLVGRSTSVYPIHGFGIPALLLRSGGIESMWSPTPMIAVQYILTAVALLGVSIWIWKKPTVNIVVVAGTGILLITWIFARWFTLSHVGVILELGVIAWVLGVSTRSVSTPEPTAHRQ